jgi:archaellum component FlaC
LKKSKELLIEHRIKNIENLANINIVRLLRDNTPEELSKEQLIDCIKELEFIIESIDEERNLLADYIDSNIEGKQ